MIIRAEDYYTELFSSDIGDPPVNTSPRKSLLSKGRQEGKNQEKMAYQMTS